MKIYKDNKENVIISLTKEENETITNALKTAVEELDLVKKGEAVTATDREYAENALKGLSVLHDVYTPDNTIADIAKRYAEPAVYYVGSNGDYYSIGSNTNGVRPVVSISGVTLSE